MAHYLLVCTPDDVLPSVYLIAAPTDDEAARVHLQNFRTTTFALEPAVAQTPNEFNGTLLRRVATNSSTHIFQVTLRSALRHLENLDPRLRRELVEEVLDELKALAGVP
jgi:hypothetical protein